MMNEVFSVLGEQLRSWRKRRGMTQPELATRLGRDRARISELERDLSNGRWGRDRLTLFAEICDALDLEPVLVPRARAQDIRAQVAGHPPREQRAPAGTAFEDIFIDLDTDDGEDGGEDA